MTPHFVFTETHHPPSPTRLPNHAKWRLGVSYAIVACMRHGVLPSRCLMNVMSVVLLSRAVPAFWLCNRVPRVQVHPHRDVCDKTGVL
jgi:hypothetical protein